MSRNESFPALQAARISARLTSAALEICPDDIDDVHVMVAGDAPEALQISFSGGTLHIRQRTAARARRPGGWTQLTLRVPRSWKGSIDARTRSGRISLRQLSGADLALRTVSGLVMGSDLCFMTVRAASLTGDVKLTRLHCERGSLVSATGQVSAALPEGFDTLQMASLSGELTVRTPIEACDAHLRSVTGHLCMEGIAIGSAGPTLRAVTLTGSLMINSTLE